MAITVYTWNGSGWNDPVTADTSLVFTQETFRQDVVLLYVDYTKGDEIGLFLTAYFKDSDVDAFFQDSYVASDILSNRTMSTPVSGTFRVPIPVGMNESEVQINIELQGATTSPGTVKIWAKPTIIGGNYA